MLFKFASILAALTACVSAAAISTEPTNSLINIAAQHVHLAKFGISSVPAFHNETAAWSHSFTVTEEDGSIWNVQVPRIYKDNQFDPIASHDRFVEVFIENGHTDLWKRYAMKLNAEDDHSLDNVVKRDFAAYLSLDYCNGKGKCTGFSLHYNGDGCQAAPGTNYIEVHYSQNASFIAWNKSGCTGRRTLFANGCNGGQEQVRDQTPGTNSFTFHVGCSF